MWTPYMKHTIVKASNFYKVYLEIERELVILCLDRVCKSFQTFCWNRNSHC